MLAIVYQGKGLIKVEDVLVPKISPNEILLRVRAASICDTDVKKLISGRYPLKEAEKAFERAKYEDVLKIVFNM